MTLLPHQNQIAKEFIKKNKNNLPCLTSPSPEGRVSCFSIIPLRSFLLSLSPLNFSWDSSFCLTCHAVSFAVWFSFSLFFSFCIMSCSSFSIFQHKKTCHIPVILDFISDLQLYFWTLNYEIRLTLSIVSRAYLFSLCFFSALDMDSTQSFSWYFIKALCLVSFFSSSSETHCIFMTA